MPYFLLNSHCDTPSLYSASIFFLVSCGYIFIPFFPDITKPPMVVLSFYHRRCFFTIVRFFWTCSKATCLFFELHKRGIDKEPPIPERKMLEILQYRLYLLGHFFKQKYFEVENEFRITLVALTATDDSKKEELNFFNRNGVMVPYIDICLEPSVLKSIRVSPTMNGTRAKDGAFMLSRKKFDQLTKADIMMSKIPLRY